MYYFHRLSNIKSEALFLKISSELTGKELCAQDSFYNESAG